MADSPNQPRGDDGASTSFESFLWRMMARFVDLPSDKVDASIRDAERQLCEAFDLDRVTLWQTSAGTRRSLCVTHLYDASRAGEAVDPATGSIERDGQRVFLLPGDRAVPLGTDAAETFPWIARRVFEGLTTAFSTLDELPPEAAVDVATLRAVGTVSNVIVPLRAETGSVGCLTFVSTTRPRSWPPDLLRRFEMVAEVFARALARKQADQVLRDREDELRRALEDLRRLRDQLQHENVYLQREIRGQSTLMPIVGTSPAIRRVLALVEQVAPTTSTVLLLGETGTGKERFAAAIHEWSPRHSRPMVRVHCGAIPGTLIESELFGREKGAYTGALTRQVGRFELAHGSTIFLDEIGDLPPDVQIKLLRVIETKTFERLGSPAPVHVDVRIIAATNRDLEQAVRDGRFREDLFYRLNVFPITLPPLRDRVEDLPLLVRAIVDELGTAIGKRFDRIPPDAIEALQRYHWPGNIRELRNVIERAMIVANGPALAISLPDTLAATERVDARSLQVIEREHIRSVLERTGWRVRGQFGAASILGLPPTTLEHRMTKLGIMRPGRRPRSS